ncbi:MAG TPA: hypothetical protein VJJ22_01010 [Candidatus Paceibacterota bacterium]
MRYVLLISSIIISTVLLDSRLALALVATSTNYSLTRDSINFVGERSTSANFSLEDTGGEVATGLGTSTNYLLNAGYQQNDGYIAISAPADVTLLPNIDGAVGGTAIGSAIWTVTTDNSTGYSLSIHAGANPALQSSGSSFANYTPAGASPDYTWSISASASEFGFSPEGTAITSVYMDNGSACSIGASDTSSACWDSITTNNKTIASEDTDNHPNGTGTTVRFQAQAGSTANQAAGTYSALITATAIAI